MNKEYGSPNKDKHSHVKPDIITGKYGTIYYGNKPKVTEKEVIVTTVPTRTLYKPLSDTESKTYSYKPSSAPESIKSMSFTKLKSVDPTVPDETIVKNDGPRFSKTTSAATNSPIDGFTDAMKKYTYALHTTASPSNLLRNQLPETPTSYYQYSGSRTGLPQVKSLPTLVKGYNPAPSPKVCMLIYIHNK